MTDNNQLPATGSEVANPPSKKPSVDPSTGQMARALLRWGSDFKSVAKAAAADGLTIEGPDPRSKEEKKFDEVHAPGRAT